MKQSTKRLTSSVAAILFLVASFVILFNLIQPAYGEISRLRGEIASRSEFAENQDRVIAAVQRLLASYESSQDAQAALSFALPHKPHVGEVIGQVHGLLAVNNLISQSFSVEPEPTRRAVVPAQKGTPTKDKQQNLVVNPPRAVNVKFKAIGSYSDFRKFVENVETNIRIMSMKEIKVEGSREQTGQNILTYEGVVEAYYQDNSQ